MFDSINHNAAGQADRSDERELEPDVDDFDDEFDEDFDEEFEDEWTDAASGRTAIRSARVFLQLVSRGE